MEVFCAEGLCLPVAEPVAEPAMNVEGAPAPTEEEMTKEREDVQVLLASFLSPDEAARWLAKYDACEVTVADIENEKERKQAASDPTLPQNQHGKAIEVSLEERVAIMQEKLSMPADIIHDLLSVAGATIVVIADDSTSMNLDVEDSDLGPGTTRWNELRHMLSQLVSMLLVIDHSEFHLKFLNEPSSDWHIIRSEDDLATCFAYKQRAFGETPLVRNLQMTNSGYGKREDAETFVLVVTDGVPTDVPLTASGLEPSAAQKVEVIRKELSGRHHHGGRIYYNFIMCTDDAEVSGLYNSVVDPVFGCDCTNDFKTERALCATKGNDINMNKFLAKCILGGKFTRKYDNLNEKKVVVCCGAACTVS